MGLHGRWQSLSTNPNNTIGPFIAAPKRIKATNFHRHAKLSQLTFVRYDHLTTLPAILHLYKYRPVCPHIYACKASLASIHEGAGGWEMLTVTQLRDLGRALDIYVILRLAPVVYHDSHSSATVLLSQYMPSAQSSATSPFSLRSLFSTLWHALRTKVRATMGTLVRVRKLNMPNNAYLTSGRLEVKCLDAGLQKMGLAACLRIPAILCVCPNLQQYQGCLRLGA